MESLDLQGKRDLYIAIHDAAKPHPAKRTTERTILDADGQVVRTETEVETWVEPGDVGAMKWALQFRIPPE